MRDPYAVLGVARTATEDEIKDAYRRLAKKLHPDLHPEEPEGELRFQDVQQAYAILKNPTLRRRFDRGFIDGKGDPRPSAFQDALREAAARREQREAQASANAAHAAAHPRPAPEPKPAEPSAEKNEREDILSEFLSTLRRGRKASGGAGSGPIPLTISFADAVAGVRTTVTLAGGNRINVTIPPGTEDGRVIKMRNADKTSVKAGEPPEIEVLITVTADPRFARDGYDLVCQVPITLPEAILGAKVPVPVPNGELRVTVPPGSNTGTVLKVRGKGIRKPDGTNGNLRVELRMVLPAEIDTDLQALVRTWAVAHPYLAPGRTA